MRGTKCAVSYGALACNLHVLNCVMWLVSQKFGADIKFETVLRKKCSGCAAM